MSVEELKNFEDMLTCGEDNQNVYRTEEFVVIQRICFSHNSIGQALTISHDYYFYRFEEVDKIYEKHFTVEGDTYEGARVKASMYIRRYVFGL